jgi:hypothetical protein
LAIPALEWNYIQEFQETMVLFEFQNGTVITVSFVVRVASKRGHSSLPTVAFNRKVAKLAVDFQDLDP